MSKQKILLGTCYFCGTMDYNRENYEPIDDTLVVNCSCNECNRRFIEVFELINTRGVL